MRFIKWALLSVLLCGSVGVISQPQVIAEFLSSPEESRKLAAKNDIDMQAVKRQYLETEFDLHKRDHIIRQQRIKHYLELAKQYDSNEWYSSRDDVLSRAKNLLTHHERMGSGIYASL
ncbi:hypothetical protein CA267_016865 [Alteromonas pelagimontana]|uniref:DUF4148 domain-containing protein n=1 Tax=Alteromonas pelagimontana TaxID=1858656 RepID=A0A6M4MI74_9ALTE|nr:hypothetical protein [Alteromonas pelagimontana]QJR82300.1 hypothetical protein CA267_016865 [Alteromonas pelagimontana]